MTSRRVLTLVLLGLALGAALRVVVKTQAPRLMFGSLSGAPKVIAVDASGNVQVKAN